MRTALKGCGCTPFVIPSGAVYHDGNCPQAPQKQLTRAEADAWRMQNRVAERAETWRLLAVSVQDHPANGTKTPLRSVTDPDYIDAHIDDRDDDG